MNNKYLNLLSSDLGSREREKIEKILKEKGLYPYELGRSILGSPIHAYTVGEGKRSLLYIASHHALESVCSNVLYMLLLTLAEALDGDGYECGVYIPLLFKAYRLIILPCLNPDGVEIRLGRSNDTPLYQRQVKMNGSVEFSFWQANARGVDLNHNYNYRFGEYKIVERERGITAGRTLFSGEYPESEPESRAVGNLIRTLMPRAVLSLHTQGEEIYFMPKGDFYTELIATRISRITGYRCVDAEGTAGYGGLCDYTGSLGIPSFTLELGRGTNPLPSSEAYTLFRRVYPALVQLPTLV